ncbi:MAG TPA: PAS domain S-box protein [Ktedonobacteraceae bacterium]|nr:PAS domain S-box protein [Ktedonobacteraceae bacterium]
MLEREHHEEETQRHEQIAQIRAQLIELAHDAIIVRDASSVVLSWNRGAERLYGWSAQEAIGQVTHSLLQTRFPVDRETVDALLATGQPWEGELVHTCKEGRQVVVESRQVFTHVTPNQPAFILEINRDITERKQRERDKGEVNQLRLAAIVESSDDAIVSKTLDGIITSWNLAAERMFGYSSQEAVGQHITLIIPEELHAEEELILSKLRKGEHIKHFETERMRKDGTRLDISLSISPMKNSAGLIIGASKIARDITESKRLQRNLQFLSEASKVLSSSLDYKTTLQTTARLAVPHIADWCTIRMLSEDGSLEPLVIAHVDPQEVQWAWELEKQYPVDMKAGHGVAQVLQRGASEFVPCISDEVLAATAVDDEHLALLRTIGFASAMTIPLLIAGRAIGTLTFALAESARRYTQADLTMAEELASRASLAIQNARLYREVQQSRDQLDIILHGVADGIVVYDSQSHIIYANEAAATMTGSPSAQALMETAATTTAARYEIMDEQRRPFPPAQFVHRRVLCGEPEAEAVMGYKPRGTRQVERWSLVKSRPIRNELGEVSMVVTIIHDITERVVAEQRKDEFVSMTSHELKTPVTSLKGFTHILQRRLEKQGDQQGLHYLSRIDTQLDKLTKLITDILDISRLQTGGLAFEKEKFNLDSLIDEIVENVQAATTTHAIVVEGSTDAQILGDKDRLGQVFINLLTNAVKYSPRSDKVLVHLSRAGNEALVSIQDFGIGIDEAYHQQIFERFYQVSDPEERTYPGLGIGLYLSKEILDRHAGRITVKSHKGEGSTFSVALPLLEEEK